jgi:hypothetical protein
LQVLDILEPQLLRAITAAGQRNDSVPHDAPLREVHVRNPENGTHEVRFIGSRSFIHDLKSIPRRVVSWNSVGGRVRANGTYF